MSDLFFRITGLCAFVPNLTSDQMRVVLVDASVPHGPHDKSHGPRLIFLKAAWQQIGGGRVPDEFFSDPDGHEMAMCDLSGQEVSIDGAGPNSLTIKGWGTGIGECPDVHGSDQFVFPWVGLMQDINAGQGAPNPKWGDIKDHFLDSSNVPSDVAARLRLTAGIISSYEFARDDKGEIVEWQFTGPSGAASGRQALSEEVQLVFTPTSPFVDLAFMNDIHGSSPTSGPKLRVGDLGGKINVWVANMPLDDIRNRYYVGNPPPPPKPTGNRDPDHHFFHFYDLVQDGPKDRIPDPFGRCPSIKPPSVDNPKCPPVQLNPAANA